MRGAWALLFGGAVLFGLLPAAPVTSDISNLAGVPLQGPLTVLWFLGMCVTSRRVAAGLPLAVCLTVIGALSLGGANSASMRVWLGSLVVPLLLFVGLQLASEDDMRSARTSVRLALLAVVGLQTFYLVREAGAAVLSPAFVFERHTDIAFWNEVGGQVLGNPNNASVVFCTAFGWAVAELALGQRDRLTLIFLALSAVSVWATGSRGAILTAGAIVVLALLLRPSTRAKPLVVLGLAGAALFLFQSWYSRLSPYIAGSSESLSARFGTREAAIEHILTSSPFGTGAGTADTSLRTSLGQVLRGDYTGATAHDPFLNWGVALGWVGLILLVCAWVVGVRRGLGGGGLLGLLPLFGFFLSAQSAGIDLLNVTNPAWSVLMWVLLGFAWRGSVLGREAGGGCFSRPERAPRPGRVDIRSATTRS